MSAEFRCHGFSQEQRTSIEGRLADAMVNAVKTQNTKDATPPKGNRLFIESSTTLFNFRREDVLQIHLKSSSIKAILKL